ncbi:response regulator transcription factor [Pseudofulvimonas gallinarii]|uniref:DNA-binding NarL/FixJ family response regulator n=2 Tax=Pseudofulvimonas gallinarii TaxID=634155 RepID=A0A4S3KXD8_9GAMM|nr:LuxR C-terminal-related transcriptional regulator [Pseudofulvimonas gallinarii]TCS98161.1 DNA-binding NarL/FixJ family response regulator [Pseudofulvimonas gallinarii]THD13856.1 hypothetical protein B1808_06360 [Pseudofulvimonas gallinarii]
MAREQHHISHGQASTPPSVMKPGSAASRGTVAVATDSALVERGLVQLINEQPQLRFAGGARSLRAVPGLLARSHPDVLVLDMRLLDDMPARSMPTANMPRVLLLSHRRYACIDAERLQPHTCTTFHLASPESEIAAALLTLYDCERKAPASPDCNHCPARRRLRRPKPALSARECAVFERIGHGDSNRAMAGRLGISVKTVEAHRENIKAKLGLDSRHALVSAAIAWLKGDLDLATLNPAPRERGRLPPG